MRIRPLMERVENYILFYGMPQDRMIPTHPDEKGLEVSAVQEALDVILYPLGRKEEVRELNL